MTSVHLNFGSKYVTIEVKFHIVSWYYYFHGSVEFPLEHNRANEKLVTSFLEPGRLIIHSATAKTSWN